MLTAIKTTLPGLILGLSLAAKFCINFTYLTGKLVEGEIFPTVIRSEGHSLVSVLSSLAVWPVPYIVDLVLDYKVVPLMGVWQFLLCGRVSRLFAPGNRGRASAADAGRRGELRERCRVAGTLSPLWPWKAMRVRYLDYDELLHDESFYVWIRCTPDLMFAVI